MTPKTKTPRAPTPLETALAEAVTLVQTATTPREQRTALEELRTALGPLLTAHALRLTHMDLRDAHHYLETEAYLAALRFEPARGVYPTHYLALKVREATWAELRRAGKRRAREALFPTDHPVFAKVTRKVREIPRED